MRKFKVWNKTDKKWMDDYAFALVDDGKELLQWVGLCDSAWERVDEFDFDYEIIFYTGRKDKNGKEMCGGDIVVDDWYPSESHPIELPMEGRYKIIYLAPEWCCEKIGNGYSGILNMNDFSEIKIIGNIYENPDIVA